MYRQISNETPDNHTANGLLEIQYNRICGYLQ